MLRKSDHFRPYATEISLCHMLDFIHSRLVIFDFWKEGGFTDRRELRGVRVVPAMSAAAKRPGLSLYRLLLRSAKLMDRRPALKGLIQTQVRPETDHCVGMRRKW